MGRTAEMADQFAARNTKPLGLATDTAAENRKWIADVNDTQHTDLQFPIVADADLKIARMYDMIHPEQSETAAVRSVFIIDPNKKIRLTMTYPMSVGRNFDEILRVRSEEHTSELQSLMRNSYAVFCLKKNNNKHN